MKKVFLTAGLLLAALCGTVQAQGSQENLLAFPGAEGFGRYAKGARASATPEIYHVTNLDDSGTGSLRDAVSKSNRIVVFDVAGVIKLKSRLVFSGNLTVAGQTAPGEGVVVYGNGVSFSGAKDVIVRHMRFRMGNGGDSGKDAAGIANGSNMIFDHVSVSWGRDENFSISWDNKGTEPGDITIQNSIIGQGIQTHSCGGLIQTNGGVTLYRNLYIDNKTRNPKTKGLNQYVNNVVYNWGSGGCYILGDTEGSSWATIEDNYFVRGPVGGTNAFTRATPQFQVFQKGNKIDYNKDGVLNGYDATEEDYRRSEDINVTFVDSYNSFNNCPKVHPAIAGQSTAEEAYYWIVNNAGASLPVRDQVDEYMIDELLSLGTKGELINGESDLGLTNNVGLVFQGKRHVDSDGDGIPDFWEEANGLDKNNKADALAVAANGYLNIENYINSIAEPAPYVRYPTTFQVYNLGKEDITLKWANNAKVATAIILEYSTDNVNFTPITLATDVTMHKVENLTPNTTYYFRIKTVNGEVESLYSETIKVGTLGDPAPPIASVNPIPANGGSIMEYSTAKLSWENHSGTWGGVLLYTVMLGTSADALTAVATDIKTTNYTATVAENTTYYWRIDTRNALGAEQGEVWSFTSGAKPKREKVAYYSFDQTEGNVLENEYGENAVARNMSPVWIEGICDRAIDFTGADGSGFVQTHYEDIALGNESFTVEFWFKSPGGAVDWYLIHKGSHATTSYEGATGRWFGVQYNKIGNNDRLTWAIDDDKTKTDLNATSASTKYFTNQWVHIACVRDVEEKKLKLYLNGELAASGDDKTGDIGTVEDMAIGNCNTAYGNAFKGAMDELSIYKGALTAEEVKGNATDPLTIGKLTAGDAKASDVYPVPFVDSFTIELGEDFVGNAIVSMLDMTGKTVCQEELIVNNGTVLMQNLSMLPKGYYICRVQYDNKIATLKVMK